MGQPLPVSLGFGSIVGRFARIVADSIGDPDSDPEMIAMAGTITITTDVDGPIQNIDSDTTFIPDPIPITLNGAGWICDKQGNSFVRVLGCDSPGINPKEWTYTVTFNFPTYKIKPVTFKVHVDETVHLSVKMPVGLAPSGGAPMIIGPPNNLLIGVVNRVPYGDPPTASISGLSPNQVLNLGLPEGPPGAGGTDATATARGVIMLAGDLGGSANAPSVPGLAGKATTVALNGEISARQDGDSARVPNSTVGQPGGVASLDVDGRIYVSELPAIIDGGFA